MNIAILSTIKIKNTFVFRHLVNSLNKERLSSDHHTYPFYLSNISDKDNDSSTGNIK